MSQKPIVAAIFVALGLLAVFLLYQSENGTNGNSESAVKSVFEIQECSTDGFPNYYQVFNGIYSGGQLDGAKGFEQLPAWESGPRDPGCAIRT